MDFLDETNNGNHIPMEDSFLIPKTEPIRDLYAEEEGSNNEKDYFVIPGIVEALNKESNFSKKEMIEHEEYGNCSSSDVSKC